MFALKYQSIFMGLESRWRCGGLHHQLASAITITRFLDEMPDPWRRQRQLARLNAQGDQRGGDRVGEHATDRNDPALACAFGAERIVGRRIELHRYGANMR